MRIIENKMIREKRKMLNLNYLLLLIPLLSNAVDKFILLGWSIYIHGFQDLHL